MATLYKLLAFPNSGDDSLWTSQKWTDCILPGRGHQTIPKQDLMYLLHMGQLQKGEKWFACSNPDFWGKSSFYELETWWNKVPVFHSFGSVFRKRIEKFWGCSYSLNTFKSLQLTPFLFTKKERFLLLVSDLEF